MENWDGLEAAGGSQKRAQGSGSKRIWTEEWLVPLRSAALSGTESTEARLLAGLGFVGLLIPTMASWTRPLVFWVGR
jgi:hypothetical protein